MRLQCKLAIITAAASGLGKAGVELFVCEGARVAAIDINPDALVALQIEHGYAVTAYTADLSAADNIKAIIASSAAALGGVDIIWAHAGIPGAAEVEEVDLGVYQRAIDLNITSALISVGEVAPNHAAGQNLISERQINHAIECLDWINAEEKKALQPTKPVFDAWQKKVETQMAKMIWSHPRAYSYYNNSKKRNFMSWPWRLVDFWNECRGPRKEDFELL